VADELADPRDHEQEQADAPQRDAIQVIESIERPEKGEQQR